ncbi:MAG: cupin domain-containing protein [Candidatus Sericytochromatia bacterium]|nr:cupin domain-containing protein [Candidatus Sericytochromatia bacterium]
MQVKNIGDFFRCNADKISKNPVFESSHLFFDVYGILPGQSQKVHTHEDSDKIYSVLEGEVCVILGDEQRNLVAGETVMAESGVAHGIVNQGLSPAYVLVVMAPKPQ